MQGNLKVNLKKCRVSSFPLWLYVKPTFILAIWFETFRIKWSYRSDIIVGNILGRWSSSDRRVQIRDKLCVNSLFSLSVLGELSASALGVFSTLWPLLLLLCHYSSPFLKYTFAFSFFHAIRSIIQSIRPWRKSAHHYLRHVSVGEQPDRQADKQTGS